MKVSYFDLKEIYENEIRKNVKNKRNIFLFERNKVQYLLEAKKILENESYNGGRYNIFLVFEPKIRVVMSQNSFDKVINHYITRKILMPKLDKYLSDRNCATRDNMGTSYAIRLFKKEIEWFKKKYQDNFYVLKLDIKKYFPSIDHQVLLDNLKGKLEDSEIHLIKNILNSTNKPYINNVINNLANKYNTSLPLYEKNKGLPIGNMTSQFFAIYYLSNLHHYMRCNMQLRFVNYMDDFAILHNDKKALEKALETIKKILKETYKLDINKNKTVISKITQGVNFLGYNFKVKKNKTYIKLAASTKKNIKRRIRKNNYLFSQGLIEASKLFGCIQNYRYGYSFVKDKTVNNILELYY